MSMASAEYLRHGKLSSKELEAIMVRGGTPEIDDLVGWEFRGMNIAFWAAHSPIQKFIKGFYRDPQSGGTGAQRGEARTVAEGSLTAPLIQGAAAPQGHQPQSAFGYNEPVVQNGPEGPWIAKPSDDDPKRFGFYRVDRVDPAARDNTYLHALLLDYGKGGNFRLDPVARLRDYLVTIPDTDLILGKAYLAFGPARVGTNFFVLERHRESSWVR